MPSYVNTPQIAVVTSTTISNTAEKVIATVSNIQCDTPQYVVGLDCCVDVLNSSSGTTLTLKLERGTAAAGTAITSGGTWGPFTLTASARSNYSISGYDIPGLVAGQAYVLTATVAGNSGTFTIETATIQAIVSSAT